MRSPAYQTYVTNLLALHLLFVRGLQDSQEADDVREEMDVPWYAMTDEERTLLEALSTCLFCLHEPLDRDDPTPDQAMALANARAEERWLEVATMLADCPKLAKGDEGFLLRAQVWEALGEPKAAELFRKRVTPCDTGG